MWGCINPQSTEFIRLPLLPWPCHVVVASLFCSTLSPSPVTWLLLQMPIYNPSHHHRISHSLDVIQYHHVWPHCGSCFLHLLWWMCVATKRPYDYTTIISLTTSVYDDPPLSLSWTSVRPPFIPKDRHLHTTRENNRNCCSSLSFTTGFLFVVVIITVPGSALPVTTTMLWIIQEL